MINSITLLGSSSGRNAGDAALMSGIMDSVDLELKQRTLYEIPTINPSFVHKEYHHNVKPISVLPWNLSIKLLGLPTYQSVMRTDLSLIFDAVLFDRALYNPLFNFLSTFYLMLPRAKRNGKKLGCYNVGLGPVTTPTGRSMLRDVLEEMDFIAVRDEGALKVMEDIGVTNPRKLLTADAALNAPASPKERVGEILNSVGLKLGEDILAININTYLDTWAGLSTKPLTEEQFLSVFADAINQLLEKHSVPVLFVCTYHSDVDITNKLKARIKSKERIAILSNKELTHIEVKGVLREVSLLVAMRLHAGILASSELTPVIGLAYQPKVNFYFEMLQQEQYCHSFADFNAQYFTEAIIRGWEERKTMKAHLVKRIPELQAKAFNGAKLVAAVSRGENIEKLIHSLQSENLAHGYGNQQSSVAM